MAKRKKATRKKSSKVSFAPLSIEMEHMKSVPHYSKADRATFKKNARALLVAVKAFNVAGRAGRSTKALMKRVDKLLKKMNQQSQKANTLSLREEAANRKQKKASRKPAKRKPAKKRTVKRKKKTTKRKRK